MQESLEEYINFNKNARKGDGIKISNEMVVTAQLQKQCDDRAMKIVEFSIEGKLRPEIFTKSLQYISSTHYQDIIEERAITKLCGYPLCGSAIPDMPKKQYYISTKNNKIYDITERKNFCSNFCYNASLHIKKQISSCPLWLRSVEEPQKYDLLQSSKGGLPGEYIDQGIVKPVSEPKFSSISSFAEESLNDMIEMEKQPERDKQSNSSDMKILRKSTKLKSTMQTIAESIVEEDLQVADNVAQTKDKSDKSSNILRKDVPHHKKNCVCNLPAIKEQDSEDKINNGDLNKNKDTSKVLPKRRGPILIEAIPMIQTKKTPLPTVNIDDSNNLKKNDINTEQHLNELLNSWLTVETCIYLHGEKKIREILNEDQLSNYFDNLNIVQLQMEQQMKYVQICRRLKFQEIADEKFHQATTSDNYKLKPLPDFKKLKEDFREMNLKVKCFLNGVTYPLDQSGNDNKENEGEDNNWEPTIPTVMPQTENNSVIAIRKKIFLNSVNKVLQQILPALDINYFPPILSDIQGLIKTFNLKADNITLKPKLWNYVGLILLYLLALKDKSLNDTLQTERSRGYISMMMGSLPSQTKFLDDVVAKINDVTTFTKQYIIKN